MFAKATGSPLDFVVSPEGRFHHDGQPALYTSETAHGAGVAIKRYVSEGDAPRVIIPIKAELTGLMDLRGNAEVSVVWQHIVASGAPSPTWAFSDAARKAGATGLLYASRTQPALTHICLFDTVQNRLTAGSHRAWP